MDKYTIYCTTEQTKKALELGAPIQFASINDIRLGRYIEVEGNNEAYEIPTAEQMIGWLRSKGFRFKIDEWSDTIVAFGVTFHCWYIYGQSSNPKGATLAAIDAALDYLEVIRI